MRILATAVLVTAATIGVAAPASADPTPFPVCHHIYDLNGRWFGGVCVDPANAPCVVYGGGYVWNLCW